MNALPGAMQKRLSLRQSSPQFRQLRTDHRGIDFLSSDYLGFARSHKIKKKICQSLKELPLIGSTSSRLLSGNHEYICSLEYDLARYFNSEASLLFTSAYTLNVAMLPALCTSHDAVLLDEQVHTSLKNSVKLSDAQGYYFRHNNLDHFSKRLASLSEKKKSNAELYVVVESLYSMDGDLAPLREISNLCEEHEAYLIVDEAHALGTIGKDGKGLVSELKLESKVLARIFGFGKAMGSSGGAIVGSPELMKYLVNFCHSFIYSTGLSFLNALSIRESFEALKKSEQELAFLKERVNLMGQALGLRKKVSPIFSLKVSPIDKLHKLTDYLRKKGFQVQPIFSPTVRRGEERLRLCVHSYNTEAEIHTFAETLKEFSYEFA